MRAGQLKAHEKTVNLQLYARQFFLCALVTEIIRPPHKERKGGLKLISVTIMMARDKKKARLMNLELL